MYHLKEENIVSSWVGGKLKPVVSIICITYNHEDYIEEALNGFLAQETNFPFEVIIHDDASTDRTTEIVRLYAKHYPKIIKLKLKNFNTYSKEGLAFINELIREAKGEYIAICEGDDFWTSKDKLSKQVGILNKYTNCSISIHNAIVEDGKNDESRLFNSVDIPEILSTKDILFRGWFSPTASFLFRNDEWAGQINKDLNGDMVILFECSLKGQIHYCSDVMSVYRYFSKSSLSKSSDKKTLYRKKINFYTYAIKRTKGVIKFYLLGLIVFVSLKSLILAR